MESRRRYWRTSAGATEVSKSILGASDRVRLGVTARAPAVWMIRAGSSLIRTAPVPLFAMPAICPGQCLPRWWPSFRLPNGERQ